MTPTQIATAFVDRINAHDLDGLCTLMADDHVFIDGLGHAIVGREAMRKAWQTYFTMVPDYFIRIEDIFEGQGQVAIIGRAGGTYTHDGDLHPANRWEVPAAWRAAVGETAITLWQVFADNEPVREIMARHARNESAT